MCCRKGKVALPPIRMHPVISAILSGPSAIRRHFIDKSRAFNNLFAWTSQGAKFDTSFKDGFHQVRINGEVCHKMGPLLPRPGDEPNFAQIHILDDEAQVERRMGIMTGLRRDVVQRVQSMISADNPFARAYRYASNVVSNFLSRGGAARPDLPELALSLVAPSGDDDRRRLNLPTGVGRSEIAAFIPEATSIGPFAKKPTSRDIQVRTTSLFSTWPRLSDTH